MYLGNKPNTELVKSSVYAGKDIDINLKLEIHIALKRL